MSCRFYDFLINYALNTFSQTKQFKYNFETSQYYDLYKNQTLMNRLASKIGMNETIGNSVRHHIVGKAERNEIDYHKSMHT